MPRKGPAPKRPIDVDPVYGSPVVTQLVNKILMDGKKQTAQRIVYTALEGARDKTGTDPVVTLKPALEVRSRRVGGATYQVPVEVRGTRSMTLALRWLVSYSQARREKTMAERLMNEILDASNGLGAAVKRREDTHKMAEANRAFSHFKWSIEKARYPDRGTTRSARTNAEHRKHRPYRRRQDDRHRADPLLHEEDLHDR